MVYGGPKKFNLKLALHLNFPTFQHQTNSWQWGYSKYNDYIPFCTTILLIVLLYTISISKDCFQWVYYLVAARELKVMPTRTPVTTDATMATKKVCWPWGRCWQCLGDMLRMETLSLIFLEGKITYVFFCVCFASDFLGRLCQYPVNPWPKRTWDWFWRQATNQQSQGNENIKLAL